MHTLSTRTLSARAYERGEEYDPSLPPVTPAMIEQLALLERGRPIVSDPGDYERRRQAERVRRSRSREASQIPEWFSARDLIAAPWESAEQRFA
jgi:hypothetical protein